jgi:signal transduction histidine kinase/ligand-binding sensor domain-containing protein/DNA-binding response OmpR family regulator
MIFSKKYFFLLFISISNCLLSQNKFENFQFLGIKEEISKRAVSAIVQDPHGFMWIGTNGAGLYKYDGVNYISYEYDWKKSNSINSNLIYTIYVDTHNRIWVGTDEGLCLYNRNFDKFFSINLKKAFGTRQKSAISVKSIIEDNSGNLLLGTYGNGLLILKLKTLEVTSVKSDLNFNNDYLINCFAKSKKGEIYLGTSFGLKEFDAKTNKVNQVVLNSNNSKKIIPQSIESLLIDKNDDVWLGTIFDGLIKISRIDNLLIMNSFSISNKRIMSMIDIGNNTIFCATENDGLILIDNNGNLLKKYVNSKFDSNSLSSNSIWSLYLDKDNRVWLGYYNKGVGVLDKLYKKFNVIESLVSNANSLQTSSVTGIVKDNKGKLWISMDGGGVDIYDSINKDFKHINSFDKKHYSGINTNDIQTVFIDSKQNIWLGSWNGGIYFLKSGTKNFINFNSTNTKGLYSNRILSFSEDSKGIIWIGTFLKGLHYYDPRKNEFQWCNSKPFLDHFLNISNIRKVLVDSDDTVWVGTTNGLYKVITNKDMTFSVFSMKDKMSKNSKEHKSIHSILSLYESKNKTIWIGTDGAGLFSYNQNNKQYKWYNNINGLNEKSVSSIIEYKDESIWISGRYGITKLELGLNKATNFTTEDGLLVNDFNYNSVLKDGDNLYFGSYEGINYFNPNQISKTEKEPLLYLSDFKLFNKSVSPNDKKSPLSKVISETNSITLNHAQSVFSIEYVGINYTYPGKNEYAYYLEGFENNWNYVGNKRSATYTNLESGDYVFKVKSSDRGGYWNKKPLELYIKILPPWWKTNLAYFSYLFLLIFSVIYLNRFYQNRFKEKQSIKFEREKAIQIEKLNNKKLQFFTNISHEFRTPLTLIINPLEDIIKNKSDALPVDIVNKLEIIHKSSDRLSRLINELMDFNKLQFNQVLLHAQQIEVISFTKDIVSYFDEEASSRRINLSLESNTEKLLDWLDPKMYEKIIFNIVSNAFKVTADEGSIKIQINAQQKLAYLPLADINKKIESFEISVEDTGAGLDKKDISKIFDRFYQVNNLNKAYYGSTGIGLEVVRGFVELHKGKIEVESELGVGTKFTVTFPLGKDFFNENEILNEEYQLKLSKKAKLEHHFNSSQTGIDHDEIVQERIHTILIVEDNTELRDYLKNELKKYYKVITAENGKKGFELALQKLPDLILTDVIMPVMNGLEMCKNIKGDLKTSHIPLLMLSAKAMIQDKLEGIDSGADIYLSKPFDMDILKSSLAQLITSRQLMFNKFYNGITKNAKEKTTTLDNDFIQKALKFINENMSESDLSVEVLASKVFLSRSQLYRKLKTLTGVSVNEFIRNVRLEKAKQLIEVGNNNINEISYKVGFNSPSYFTKCYKAKYAHLPTQINEEKDDLE